MIQIDVILAEVKANHAKLNTCTRHDFSIALDRRTKAPLPPGSEKQIFSYWRCSKCGGYVDGLHKVWYERGLEHASAP